MSNPIKGEVPLTIGGRDLILNFTVDAICKLEGRLGLTPREIGAKILTDDGIVFLRNLFWAALVEHQPELNVRQAGELIRAAAFEGVDPSLKIIEAWALSWPLPRPTPPEGEDAESGDARPPTRPTTAAPRGTGSATSGSGKSTASAAPPNSGP